MLIKNGWWTDSGISSDLIQKIQSVILGVFGRANHQWINRAIYFTEVSARHRSEPKESPSLILRETLSPMSFDSWLSPGDCTDMVESKGTASTWDTRMALSWSMHQKRWLKQAWILNFGRAEGFPLQIKPGPLPSPFWRKVWWSASPI